MRGTTAGKLELSRVPESYHDGFSMIAEPEVEPRLGALREGVEVEAEDGTSADVWNA